MYLLINKCVTAVKVSSFSGHYLRNRSTLDIGVLGYMGIVQHKEHSPEVLSIPPGTPCIYMRGAIFFQSLYLTSKCVIILQYTKYVSVNTHQYLDNRTDVSKRAICFVIHTGHFQAHTIP